MPTVEPAKRKVTATYVSANAGDRVALRHLFRHTNWRIFEAATCREARSSIERSPSAILLCDLLLPDGDWQELCGWARNQPAPPMTIAVTEPGDEWIWPELLRAGAYDTLSKPFQRDEVTQVISLAWRRWLNEPIRNEAPKLTRGRETGFRQGGDRCGTRAVRTGGFRVLHGGHKGLFPVPRDDDWREQTAPLNQHTTRPWRERSEWLHGHADPRRTLHDDGSNRSNLVYYWDKPATREQQPGVLRSRTRGWRVE